MCVDPACESFSTGHMATRRPVSYDGSLKGFVQPMGVWTIKAISTPQPGKLVHTRGPASPTWFPLLPAVLRLSVQKFLYRRLSTANCRAWRAEASSMVGRKLVCMPETLHEKAHASLLLAHLKSKYCVATSHVCRPGYWCV